MSPEDTARPQPPDDLITCKVAARLLDVHVATIYRWVSEGKLPSYVRGGCRRLVSRAELMGLIRRDDRRPPPPPPPVAFGQAQRERQARERETRRVLGAAGFAGYG